MDAGADIGVKLYGTEAMTVMRVEKGHVASGELNGMTTASDLGLGRLMSTKKDFIGAVLARRAALQDSDRPGLVGLRPLNPAKRINAGAHFLEIGASADLASDLGYMTTATYSEALASWIGLGFVRGGRARVGERVRAYDPVRGSDVEVEVCNPVFYDPEGQRLHG